MEKQKKTSIEINGDTIVIEEQYLERAISALTGKSAREVVRVVQDYVPPTNAPKTPQNTLRARKNSRANMLWTHTEDKTMREMLEQNASIKKVARQLGRTTASVYTRACQKGLLQHKKTRKPRKHPSSKNECKEYATAPKQSARAQESHTRNASDKQAKKSKTNYEKARGGRNEVQNH